MADVADILGMGRTISQSESDSVLGDKPKEKVKGKGKKPAGMSREVFALIGKDGLAPTVVTKKAAFKEKRDPVSKTRWVWTSFKNSGRKDGCEIFRHWTKMALEYPDYPFARFNIPTPAINFTDQEYTANLDDPEWSLEETRVLCQLVERFDRRWPVVMDRYPHEKFRKPRTVEDLQRRYYGVWQSIKSVRAANPGSGPLLPLGLDETNDTFDLPYERKRRHQLELLFKRTRAEEEEEGTLREELKSIDQSLRKVKKHPTQRTVVKQPQEARNAVAMGELNLALSDKNIYDARPEPRPGQPYLQSARLSVPAQPPKLHPKMLTKVRTLLTDLGLAPRPLPTKTVCDLYDELRKDMVELFSVQKLVKQREAQLDALRQGEDAAQVFNRVQLGGVQDRAVGAVGPAGAQKGAVKRKAGPQWGRQGPPGAFGGLGAYDDGTKKMKR